MKVPDTEIRLIDGTLIGRFLSGTFTPDPRGLLLIGRLQPCDPSVPDVLRRYAGVQRGVVRLLHYPFVPLRVVELSNDMTLALESFYPGQPEDPP